MKTALVTGGSVFLGTNLCLRLLGDGFRVICLDNNYTGSIENLSSCFKSPDFSFIEHDVCVPLEIEEQIDEIYNLACPASPPAYQGLHALDTTRTCVMGAFNMLELACKHKARILQASTSEVYGDPLVHPQTESYFGNVNPNGLRACYDEGKRCAESIFCDYARYKGAKIKIIRIFNTYGPYMDPNDGRVISNFICQALSGEDITIYGRGGQTRSFCYVSDLIDGMVRMMHSPESFQGPVNLGNPSEITIAGLAQRIIALLNSSSKLIYQELPQDDPKMRMPNIDLAKSVLDWEPKVCLDEGLIQTARYFKEHLYQFKNPAFTRLSNTDAGQEGIA